MDAHIKDSDIHRSASDLMRRYGKDAPTVATMRADAFLHDGDLDGYRRWKRVVLVLDNMLTEDELDPEGTLFH